MSETGETGDGGALPERREDDGLVASGKQTSSGKADLETEENSGLSSSQTPLAFEAPVAQSSPEQGVVAGPAEQENPPTAEANAPFVEGGNSASGTVRVPQGITVEVVGAAPLGPELTSARLGTDRPSTIDELGFRDYARAIARFLTHSDSEPPLTISIQAPWGGGKSSLMRMIQNELDASKREGDPKKKSAAMPSATTARLSIGDVNRVLSETRPVFESALPKIPKATGAAARQRVTVWFNAWKYENTNQVWAGLVDAILQQVPERLAWREREQFWAQLNLKRIGVDRIRQRLHEHVLGLALRSSVGLLRALAIAAVTALIPLVL